MFIIFIKDYEQYDGREIVLRRVPQLKGANKELKMLFFYKYYGLTDNKASSVPLRQLFSKFYFIFVWLKFIFVVLNTELTDKLLTCLILVK